MCPLTGRYAPFVAQTTTGFGEKIMAKLIRGPGSEIKEHQEGAEEVFSTSSAKQKNYRLASATRAACGPSVPCSSMNVTSVPNLSSLKSTSSRTLFRWK
jgi:hypothetical protein